MFKTNRLVKFSGINTAPGASEAPDKNPNRLSDAEAKDIYRQLDEHEKIFAQQHGLNQPANNAPAKPAEYSDEAFRDSLSEDEMKSLQKARSEWEKNSTEFNWNSYLDLVNTMALAHGFQTPPRPAMPAARPHMKSQENGSSLNAFLEQNYGSGSNKTAGSSPEEPSTPAS
jgi:hypothetical protein